MHSHPSTILELVNPTIMSYLTYGMMISVPRPIMTTPNTAIATDCAGNVYHDPNTVTIILPALMVLPPTHCTIP